MIITQASVIEPSSKLYLVQSNLKILLVATVYTINHQLELNNDHSNSDQHCTSRQTTIADTVCSTNNRSSHVNEKPQLFTMLEERTKCVSFISVECFNNKGVPSLIPPSTCRLEKSHMKNGKYLITCLTPREINFSAGDSCFGARYVYGPGDRNQIGNNMNGVVK